MTPPQAPPPVLDFARVLAYAVVAPPVSYVERQTLYVDGKLLGAVPRVAICQNLGEAEVLVFHCDEDWHVRGVAGGHTAVETAKASVERSYPGISQEWVELNTSEEEATAYLDEVFSEDRCSFCGRMPHQVTRMFVSDNGRICDLCVNNFTEALERGE